MVDGFAFREIESGSGLVRRGDRSDCLGMGVASGDSVEVLAAKRSIERHAGVVIAASQNALAVGFDKVVAWVGGEDVYLLTQTTAGRLVSVGEFERHTGDVAIFRVLAPWTVYNRRLHRRYAANARVGLRAEDQSETDGHIVDISLNGARVSVDAVPESPAVALRLGMGGAWADFPCIVRGTIIEGDAVFVRLRFRALSVDEVEMLQRFLTLLEGLERHDPWSFTA